MKFEIYHHAAYMPFHGAYLLLDVFIFFFDSKIEATFWKHTATIECMPIQICVMIETYKSDVQLQWK